MARETKAQVKARERQEAIDKLRRIFDSGESLPIINTVLVHVSRSGMQRVIKPMIIHNGTIWDITPEVSKILDWRIHPKHYGVTVDGCGMDMGFHLVYSLSASLYGHADQGGYKIKHHWL